MMPEDNKNPLDEHVKTQAQKNGKKTNLAEPFKDIRDRLLQRSQPKALAEREKENKKINLQQYEESFLKIINAHTSLNEKNYQEFKRLQKILNLTNEDVKNIENKILNDLPQSSEHKVSTHFFQKRKNGFSLHSNKQLLIKIAIGLGCLGVGAKILWPNLFTLPSGIISIPNFQENLPDYEKDTSLSDFLTKQASTISSIAISEDGETIVIGGSNKKIIVASLTTGKLITTFENDSSSYINAVAIRSDGKRIVSGDLQGTLRVWEIGKKEPLYTFSDHSPYSILSVAITPNGEKIISSDIQGTIKIWDSKKGELINTLIGHSGGVNSVIITPDITKIISASNDSTVRVWDLQTGKQISQMKDSEAVFSLAFGSDGKKIYSGNREGTIRIWNLNIGEEIDTYKRQSQKIGALAIDSKEKILVSGSNDRTVMVWSPNNRTNKQLPESHKLYVNSVAISPNGKTILSASKNQIKVWQAK